MVKFDALKTAINVLRHWFGEKILGLNQKIDDMDSKIVQADYDQNDPEQLDYIKNRPFYDVRNRTVVISEQKCSDWAYIGIGYGCLINSNADFIEGNLYEVHINNECITTYCTQSDEQPRLICNSENGIEYIVQWSSDTFYVVGPDMSNPMVSVYIIEDDNSKIQRLHPDLVTMPHASDDKFGAVKVYPTTYPYSIHEVFIDGNGRLATNKELPGVGTYATGRFLRVNSDGKWADEKVDVALKSDISNVVSYGSVQNLSNAQKEVARTNIGAGTSSFSGSYDDLSNKPFYAVTEKSTVIAMSGFHSAEVVSDGIYSACSALTNYIEETALSDMWATFDSADTVHVTYTINGDIQIDGEYEVKSTTVNSGYLYYKYAFGNPALYSIESGFADIDNTDNGEVAGFVVSIALYNGDIQSSYCNIRIYTTRANSGPLTISKETNNIVTMDEQFIPDTIARMSDIPTVPTTVSSFENDAGYLTAPATASVGQTVVVKAVDESGKPTEWEAADILDKRMGLLNGYVINYLTAKVNQIMAEEWSVPILPRISDVMWIREVAITDTNGNISNYTSTVSSDQNGTIWYEFSASEGAAWTDVGAALRAYCNNPDKYTLVMTDEENTAYEGSSILDISSLSGYFMVGSTLLRYDETSDTIEYVNDVSGYSTVSSGADWYQHAVILALGHMWLNVYNW